MNDQQVRLTVLSRRIGIEALHLIHKGGVEDFNTSEMARVEALFDKFYMEWQELHTQQFLDYLEQQGLWDQLYLYFRYRYGGAVTGAVRQADMSQALQYTRQRLEDAPYDPATKEFSRLVLAAYNTTETNRIKALLRADQQFDLANPALIRRMQERSRWWEAHSQNTIRRNAFDTVGRLLFQGVTGTQALPEFDDISDFYRIRNERQIHVDRQRLSELLNQMPIRGRDGVLRQRSDSQKWQFVTTEAAAVLEQSAQDHWAFNDQIYNAVVWKHKFGLMQARGSRPRPNHVRMHNKTRPIDGLFETFRTAHGERRPIKGPHSSELGPEDTVHCACRSEGVLKPWPKLDSVSVDHAAPTSKRVQITVSDLSRKAIHEAKQQALRLGIAKKVSYRLPDGSALRLREATTINQTLARLQQKYPMGGFKEITLAIDRDLGERPFREMFVKGRTLFINPIPFDRKEVEKTLARIANNQTKGRAVEASLVDVVTHEFGHTLIRSTDAASFRDILPSLPWRRARVNSTEAFVELFTAHEKGIPLTQPLTAYLKKNAKRGVF